MEFISIEYYTDIVIMILCPIILFTAEIGVFCSGEKSNNTIGLFIISLVATAFFVGIVWESAHKIRAKIDVSDLSVVEYQYLIGDISNYSLDNDILTIELSENCFYHWYYDHFKPTISASDNTLIGG